MLVRVLEKNHCVEFSHSSTSDYVKVVSKHCGTILDRLHIPTKDFRATLKMYKMMGKRIHFVN